MFYNCFGVSFRMYFGLLDDGGIYSGQFRAAFVGELLMVVGLCQTGWIEGSEVAMRESVRGEGEFMDTR
jgi:hypothetical protein